MVVVPTGKIAFGPAWASAEVAAAPASANAPVARIVLRSTVSMGFSLSLLLLRMKKARDGAGLPRLETISSMLDLGRQLAAIGGELRHHLLVQPDVHARGIIAVAGIAELLGEIL